MKKLVYLFIFMFIILCPITVCAAEIVNNEEELYQKMAEDILVFKESNEYQLNFYMSIIDVDRIQAIASTKNQILGNNLLSLETQMKGNAIVMEYGYLINETEYKLCRKYAAMVGSQLDEDMTDYQKVKSVHDYICKTFEYDYLANGPFDALITGLSECEGYSMTFQMIMEYCEIPCNYINGTGHVWNTVMLDGQWYNMDVTWDDSGDTGFCNYDYFLKSAHDFPGHPVNLECAPTNYAADLSYEHFMINVTYILIGGIVLLLAIIVLIIYIVIKMYKKQQREKPKEEITFKPYNWSEQRKEKELENNNKDQHSS